VPARDGFRFFVVAHTHWDREWYLPLEHFRLELARTVDEILATLERDSRFRSFTLDGQAVLLEDYLELRPENEERLRALLRAGRLVVGPSYVLPDELLVGGESLVRNLLAGRAACRRLGGEPAAVGYMPDSFGHPAQLPQLLAGFGIGSFLFSRGVGDEVERVGRVFRWEAPDGSSVLAYNLLGHYDNAAHLRSRADLRARADALVDRYARDLERAGVQAVLLLNGSDHLPIQPELPDLLPSRAFRIASLDEYVAAAVPARAPRHRGELVGGREQNVLRGVDSARMYVKQANERAERRLLAAETAAALAALAGREAFPAADFRFAWRELLRNHPHDSICGCSVDEVHADMLERYARLERTVAVLARKAAAALAGGGLALEARDALELYRPQRRRSVVLWNTLPFARRRAAGGTVVDLPGFGGARVTLRAARRRPEDANAIENDCYRVTARANGTLDVRDKRSGDVHRGLLRFEDEPDAGDLYTFCPAPGPRWRSDAPRGDRSARVLRTGDVSELELRSGRRIRTLVRLVDGVDRIEFETHVENRHRDHRLRVAFSGAKAPVRAESAFAVVERRPVAPRVRWHEPAAATQHTGGAVAAGGLALFTKGLPEIELRGGELLLTLLRCVGRIAQPPGLATRPGGAGPPTPTPGGQCLGRHRFEFAVRFGELSEVELLRASQDYRFDFLEVPAGEPVPPPLALDGDLVFAALKGAEDGDGVVLRVFNPGRRTATLRASLPLERCRLDETRAGGSARVRPGEIATFRLRGTM
jgi:alpha-mannosidase